MVAEHRFSTPFVASEHATDNKKHLLLAATGSVAAIKVPNIIKELSCHDNLSIRLLLSEAAVNFLGGQSDEQCSLQSILQIKNLDGIYRDEDEWAKPWVRGDSILHIELRRWADIMVIAPLSADSMAKMSLGLADNLLLSVVRAWDTTGEIEGSKRKRIVLAAAMNTAMWRHPVTKSHMKTLEEWSIEGEKHGFVEILKPVEKTLACGDSGDGAMCEWSEIVLVICDRLGLRGVDG